jgi:hypothetical protein
VLERPQGDVRPSNEAAGEKYFEFEGSLYERELYVEYEGQVFKRPPKLTDEDMESCALFATEVPTDLASHPAGSQFAAIQEVLFSPDATPEEKADHFKDKGNEVTPTPAETAAIARSSEPASACAPTSSTGGSNLVAVVWTLAVSEASGPGRDVQGAATMEPRRD